MLREYGTILFGATLASLALVIGLKMR